MHCIQVFLEFEREGLFGQKDHRLPNSTHRPAQFTRWIARKRPVSGDIWDSMITGDALAFGAQWWKWWGDIQPYGRAETLSGLSRPEGIHWDRLHKTGSSGIFSVLVALVWWRHMDGSSSPAWMTAVEDVQWAMEQMQAKTAAKRRYVSLTSSYCNFIDFATRSTDHAIDDRPLKQMKSSNIHETITGPRSRTQSLRAQGIAI